MALGAVVRVRREEDIPGCITLLAAVHIADGYPAHWPPDPGAWLTPEHLITALVAEDRGVLIGHIVLQRASGDPAAVQWTAASGLPAERIAAVGRLFVAACARGHGIGAALLAGAQEEAAVHSLRAALEVHGRDRAAIALYERCGWRCVGSAPWVLASGERTVLHRYLSPG